MVDEGVVWNVGVVAQLDDYIVESFDLVVPFLEMLKQLDGGFLRFLTLLFYLKEVVGAYLKIILILILGVPEFFIG